MHTRGMSEAEARSRVAAQSPQAEKLNRADVVIDTSGAYAETARQVRDVWARMVPADRAPGRPSIVP